jgi:HD superfamily phosphodiesterase
MKKYRIDENTIWEDTGEIVLHTSPTEPERYTHLVRIYKEYKKGSFTTKRVEGEPVYTPNLPFEQRQMVEIMRLATNTLSDTIEFDKHLKQFRITENQHDATKNQPIRTVRQ